MNKGSFTVNSPAKASVVIPTYNQAKYLAACLDSIFFQDFPNIEIIVVNDASTDETHDLLDQYRDAVVRDITSFASCWNEEKDAIERTYHPRYPQTGRELKIYHNETNLGSTRNYNLGFGECTGKYCTYVASDDILHPSMISTLVKVLETEDADFAYSDMFIVNDAGQILREFKLPAYSFQNAFCSWYLCGVSKLYRTNLHDRFGYYNEAFLANDHECYLRFAMGGARFRHVPKVLYSVRDHHKRAVNVHAPSNWRRLLDESRSLVKKAREYSATRL